MHEQYIDIPNFNGYKISDTGRVWSDKSNKELTQFMSNGYAIVHLRRNKKSFARRVHRLVAAAFLDDYDDNLIVNHIDGDKTNNHVDNLECITQRQNVLHSVWELDNGQTPNRVKRLTKNEERQIIEMRESGVTVSKILETFNISGAKYRDIVNPKQRLTEWVAKPIPVEDGEQIALVNGYDHYYVSDLGNIYSSKRGIRLAQNKTANGYMHVALYKHSKCKHFLVHRLVAEAFCEKPDGCDCVDHLNECKTDNRAINLRWATRSENLQHSMRKTRTITDGRVGLVKRMHRVGLAGTEIARIVGIGKTSVYRIIHNQDRYSAEDKAISNIPDVVPYQQEEESSTKAINKDTVDEIGERYASESVTMAQLAKEYGVGVATIHRVINRLGGYA